MKPATYRTPDHLAPMALQPMPHAVDRKVRVDGCSCRGGAGSGACQPN